MKKFLLSFLGFCLLTVCADDLLRNAPWRFVSADGGAGNVEKLPDNGRKISSSAGKGYVSFANARALPVEPGRSYRVTAKVVRCDENAGVKMLVSIGKRTPWAVVKAAGEVGKVQELSYGFTAGENENSMRVHFIVSGSGAADILAVGLEAEGNSANNTADEKEVPAENVLKNAPWRLVAADGGKGKSVKNADGSYDVITDSVRGYISFANSRNLVIEPGKNYRVKAVVIRHGNDAKCNMLVSIGKRTPWAAVRSEGVAGEKDELIYDFTAGKDEKGMRMHFIVSGKGKVSVVSAEIRELSDRQMKALKEIKKVTATDFSGNALRKNWKPVNLISYNRGVLNFNCNPFGGVECKNLDWDADKIKAVDVRVGASEPGYIYFEFTTTAGQKSYLSQAAYPGFPAKDYTFHVASNPAWKGRIASVRIIWRAYERSCTLDFGRITARSKANIIPFADEKKNISSFVIDSFLPRGEYKLSFNGKNPGSAVSCFDRHGRKLALFTMPAGKESMTFQVPEMCVKSVLTMEKSSSYPCIELLNWSKPDKKAFDWRGKWIWSNTEFGPANEYVWFKREFDVKGKVLEAGVIFTADDRFTVYINGQKVSSGDNWRIPVRTEAAKFIRPGKNTIVIKTFNEAAWGGMIGELYVKTDQETRYFPTDNSWMYKIGGSDFPEKYTARALELGAPPTSPWGDLVYAYVGEKGKVTVKESGELSAVLHVDEAIPVRSDKLTFLLTFPDGSSRLAVGGVEPATDKWEKGKDVRIRISLPQVIQKGVTARLATDFIASDEIICRIPAADSGKRVLSFAHIEGTGSRAHIVINGKKYPPIYYDGYNKAANTWMLEKAKAGGCEIVRIGCSMHTMWKSENEFDFSIIDRYMDAFAVNYPDAKVILKVQVTMPDWWLAKFPDDVTAYHDGRPYSKAHDRHALASARWRKDGAYALRQLMKYLKKSPHCDRIFAIGLSEGWNSEWFWSTLGGAVSGYSKGDLATFRSYLKESYGTDAALAAAWNIPGMTFDKVTMPKPSEFDRAACGELIDPLKDQRTIDYFRFRNRALGDAIETFGKVVKEESDNRYLVGIYYGYFVMFSHVNRKLQTVGHLEIERLARSPYVDIFWAPSLYHWRQIGMPDGIMQAAETLSSFGKLVVVEQDMRTFSEPSHMQAGNGRTNTPEQTISAMHRAFGMLLARGVGTHWYDMHEIWFREPVLLEAMKEINDTYMSLSPVKGTTPVEVCIVSDQESAYYTRHNFNRNPNKGAVYEFLRTFNYAGIPFRHVFVNDLLEKDKVPAHKLYIITAAVMMTPERYDRLMKRIAAEKATVLHLYGTGVTRPDKSPSAENMEELLGMKFKMDMTNSLPSGISVIPEIGNSRNPTASNPWFYPVSGFDKVLAVGQNKLPVLVKKTDACGITVYFSTLMKPSLAVIRHIAAEAGVHFYSSDTRNAMHIGNDCLFIVPVYDGVMSVDLPGKYRLYGIIGEYKGKSFASGEAIPVRNGICAGFIVK